MDTVDWLIVAGVVLNRIATFFAMRKQWDGGGGGQRTDHTLLLIVDIVVGAAIVTAVVADISWLLWVTAAASYLMYRHVRTVVEGTLFEPETDRR